MPAPRILRPANDDARSEPTSTVRLLMPIIDLLAWQVAKDELARSRANDNRRAAEASSGW